MMAMPTPEKWNGILIEIMAIIDILWNVCRFGENFMNVMNWFQTEEIVLYS